MRKNVYSTPAMTIWLLCLISLALCTVSLSRPQPSFTDSNVAGAEQAASCPGKESKLTLHEELLQEVVSVGSLALERRSLNTKSTSGSRGKRTKASKRRKSNSKYKWGKHGKLTVLGAAIGVSVFVGVVAVCIMLQLVGQKRDEDPRWHLRNLFKSKSSSGDDVEAMEKKADGLEDVVDSNKKELDNVGDVQVESQVSSK